jgi:hypothetical protein
MIILNNLQIADPQIYKDQELQGIRISWVNPKHKSMSDIYFEAAFWEVYPRSLVTSELYSRVEDYCNETV